MTRATKHINALNLLKKYGTLSFTKLVDFMVDHGDSRDEASIKARIHRLNSEGKLYITKFWEVSLSKPRIHKPALRGNGTPSNVNRVVEEMYASQAKPLRAHDYVHNIIGLDVGSLVQFYSDGLRAGHIESISKGIAKIRPIAPYKAGPGRLVKKPLVELIICARPSHGEGRS